MICQMWRSAQFVLMGLRHFTKDGYKSRASVFDNSVMERDLSGRTCFVTGANQGIGYQAALDLAQRRSTVYMVCRNKERGQAAVESVRSTSGNSDVHLKICDISCLAQVRELAADIDREGLPCHVLVNNAGCMVHKPAKSADGHEINFATNTLGTFALTSLMMPSLTRAAKAAPQGAKVVFVTSGGMYTEALEVEDLQMEKRKMDATVQYARDKRRQVAMCERFAEKSAGTNVKFVSMHPGWTETEGVKGSLPEFSKAMSGRLRSLPEGADTITWLAASDNSAIEDGALYLDRAVQTKHLWLAGTEYQASDVDWLLARLTEMADLSTA